MTTGGTAALYESSFESPWTQRQSAPALSMLARPRTFAHCAIVPAPSVGTC